MPFGFVYVHSFEDGYGRLHRYLIHHVLAGRGFHPVSFASLESVDTYEKTLEGYCNRLLPGIACDATADGDIEVRSDTVDFYCFLDATPHAEFLCRCVRKIID